MLIGVLQPGAISFISLFKESLTGILLLSNAMPLHGSIFNVYIFPLL